MVGSSAQTGGDGTVDAVAERAWVLRYADPEAMARLTENLDAGPEKQVLDAFLAWREQRLDDAASLTMTIGDDPDVPHRWRARALNVRGGLLAELGLLRESFDVRQQSLEQARLAKDRVGEIACVHGFGVVYEQSDPFRAQQQYLQTLRLITDAQDATEEEREQLDGIRAVCAVNLHGLQEVQGLDHPEWVPSLADVREGAQVAWPEMGAVITATLAAQALDAGDLDTAARLAAECPDPRAMRDVAISPNVASLRSRLLVARGDVAGAVDLLEDLTRRLPPRHLPEALEALMRVHEQAGDIGAAYAVALRLLEANRTLPLSTTANAVRALEVLYRTEHAEAEARRATLEARRATQTLDTLQEEQTRDALTGVRNRRYLVTAAPGILALSGAAMAVVDVDNFKDVNDLHGHVVGDDVLQRVADALRDATRPEDVVARYGGDEFVVLRPAGGGQALADDLRDVAVLPAPDGPHAEDQTPIRLSIGVADTRTRWDATLPIADRAMYEVKRAGGGGVGYAG